MGMGWEWMRATTYLSKFLLRYSVMYWVSLAHIILTMSLWLKIIKDAAKLWTFVTDATLTYASLALKRSRSHAISLSIASELLNRSLYTAVLNHLHHWIRADI
ncbi:hypothetical protein FRB94_001526 [Tulasnella sp. JGI-2019a]|nr:hypothetical protein FRB94_001526 [Tulasnella sp. JGI-2019a]